LADKSTQLVLEALGRAVAIPGGSALHGTRSAPGLFASTAPARQAAQRCKDEGYLRILRAETKGKSVKEICAITDQGLAYLLSQVSPKQVLEDFIRALESRQEQVSELVTATRQWQSGFEALRASVEKVLQQIQKPTASWLPAPPSNGSETWTDSLLSYLTRWQESGATGDCPLPELYHQAQQAAPHLTIGRFHDGLRRLHEENEIYLHPWTGPLYEIPEPPYALLVGHEIAYYASRRSGER
jgi:hypothetical protein